LKVSPSWSARPAGNSSRRGAQVRITDGELSVVDGPFVEAKEVIGGYAIFELCDKEEALGSAKQFMQLHKDLMPGWEGTCELRALASRAA